MPDDARRPDPEALARYDDDVALWSTQQAALLRAGRWDALDIEHLADEIEDVGKSEFRALVSALSVTLLHMLKWDHQPERRGRSWRNSIGAGRVQANRRLRDSPSFRRRLDEAIRDAYEDARREASTETDLPLRTFPETCPYTVEDIFDRPHGDEED